MIVSFMCPHCSIEIQHMLTWPDVRKMLEGHPVPNVYPHPNRDGWTVKDLCSGAGGCGQLWSYAVTADELEQQAAKEVKRRKRMGIG
jgi:hypothetical protein